MLYEGSELLGAMGLFKLHCSQHWAPRASLSYTARSIGAQGLFKLHCSQHPSGTCSERKILEQCGLLIGHFKHTAAVGLKAATLSQPLDISQNRKFFNATNFSKNAKIV